MAKSKAIQATMQALSEISADSPVITEDTVLVPLVREGKVVEVNIDSAFGGDYGQLTATKYNAALEVGNLALYQWLHPKARPTTSTKGFNLSSSDEKAWKKLASLYFDMGSDQEAFTTLTRAAQKFWVDNMQRQHNTSVGTLVKAIAAYQVSKAMEVHSMFEPVAKPFRETLKENAKEGIESVFKPKTEGGKSDGKKEPPKDGGMLKPSEADSIIQKAEAILRLVGEGTKGSVGAVAALEQIFELAVSIKKTLNGDAKM